MIQDALLSQVSSRMKHAARQGSQVPVLPEEDATATLAELGMHALMASAVGQLSSNLARISTTRMGLYTIWPGRKKYKEIQTDVVSAIPARAGAFAMRGRALNRKAGTWGARRASAPVVDMLLATVNFQVLLLPCRIGHPAISSYVGKIFTG